MCRRFYLMCSVDGSIDILQFSYPTEIIPYLTVHSKSKVMTWRFRNSCLSALLFLFKGVTRWVWFLLKNVQASIWIAPHSWIALVTFHSLTSFSSSANCSPAASFPHALNPVNRYCTRKWSILIGGSVQQKGLDLENNCSLWLVCWNSINMVVPLFKIDQLFSFTHFTSALHFFINWIVFFLPTIWWKKYLDEQMIWLKKWFILMAFWIMESYCDCIF